MIGCKIVAVFVLCSFQLEINPTSFDANENTMLYADFITFKDHKFLRNIFSNEELSKTDALKDLKTFHEKFVRFLRITVSLQNAFKINEKFDECFDDGLLDFCRNNCADCPDFGEIKELISDVKIKNKSNTKISKFTVQTNAFVYRRLIDFPQGKFDYETVTTLNIFESVRRIIDVKKHLHHSHVTGKIISYAHDFCNLKVRENQNQFTCIAHNFFGFDMFILIKGIRLSIWGTKDVNIGETGLTNINFASISTQVKFIDTMKLFLTSLGQLASILDDVEKKLEKLNIHFLKQHRYFSHIWKQLKLSEKKEISDIIVGGKGVIPYEKINSIDSLNLKPEDGVFFLKDECFSTLDGKAVDDEDYLNSKKLYTLLQMRDFSDLNDLYNVQDVILLLEIIDKSLMYKPRKCNSASKLSSCIQREQSKVILALPMNNSVMEVFEKTLTGGLSCINTRLSFDTELLIPNLTESDYKKLNIDESFKAYKRDDLKLIYKIELGNEGSFDDRRIITKILKKDESNQYGFAMTKPMPTGCIKKHPALTWCKFNFFLEKVDLDDQIGHLFLVDIESDKANVTKREYMYNEIMPSIIEKQKILETYVLFNLNPFSWNKNSMTRTIETDLSYSVRILHLHL